MNNFNAILCGCFAAVLLAGCGGSQPPIGAQGAIVQGHSANTEGKSRILPASSSDSLVYVVTHGSAEVRVYSYPELTTAETLTLGVAPVSWTRS
jgi:hypothetical protein